MTEKEKQIREKARTYVACFSDQCPLREHCLHALVRPYTPQDPYVATTINMANPAMQTKKCPMYRSDQPVRMVCGIAPMYHDMPGWLERTIKNWLIHRYSRKRYYEYHNGTRPLPPAEETHIRQLLKGQGWNDEPKFAGYVEEIQW